MSKLPVIYYPTQYFSPYRSEKLGEELVEIITTDVERLTSVMYSRGLKFLIAITLILILSSMKCVRYLIQEYSKPVAPALEIPRENINSLNRDYHYLLESNKLTDNLINNHEIKSVRSEALNELREILYKNNFELKGYIIKVTNHKVSDEDFLLSAKTGTVIKAFSTTQITFGYEVNRLLSKILPDEVTLKKRRKFNDTYIVFAKDDYGFLEEHLKKLYWKPVKVLFDDISND